MPSIPKKNQGGSLFLIHGEDDFLVTEEARKIIATLAPQQASDFNLETIEGSASNEAQAQIVFKKLFESLQSNSFFAAEKTIWWRNTNLLGRGATAGASFTTSSLAALNNLLKAGLPPGFSLVITATEVDERRAIVKTFKDLGKVIAFKTDPYKAQENQAKAAQFAREMAEKLEKEIEEEAALRVAEMSSGDSRTICSEIEKISTYVGSQKAIREADVQAVGSRRPGGMVWDLPDSLSERNLGKALKILENLLDLRETPMGLLFALIPRFRLLLVLSALEEKKLLKTGGNYASFKSQLDRLPSWVLENLPEDKRLNPLMGHPFMLWKASSGVGRYSRAELQRALEALLECNERMVSGSGDPPDILKETLIRICVGGDPNLAEPEPTLARRSTFNGER